MNKLIYIKLSHQEANNKIWNFLMAKYRDLKGKNILVAYMWLFLSCTIFGLVAVFGWFAYLTILFQDIRFTPHYLRTVINYNEMNQKEATKYLDSQKQIYINSLAYGNISNREKYRIEASFDIVYEEYVNPEIVIEDGNCNAVINHLQDIKTTVNQTQSDVQYISEYTHI